MSENFANTYTDTFLKGEHWCKTIIKGAQDWDKTKTSASAVFEKNVLCKRNKPPKMKKLHFLAS